MGQSSKDGGFAPVAAALNFGVMPSPQICPYRLIERKIRPLEMPLAAVQVSIARLTQIGIGTVRM